MKLVRATNAQIASFPPVAYDAARVAEKMGEDGQGRLFIAVMFQRPPRAEIFMVVDDGQEPDAGEVDRLVAKMVMEEP